MPVLTAEKLIIALKKLSSFIADPDQEFKSALATAGGSNAWFTAEEVNRALNALHNMLNGDDLNEWFKNISVNSRPEKIGLILAGNIPLVGFHDVLCVLATGNIALIKLSSSDEKLLPALLARLIRFEPALQDHIVYVERLKEFDAIIATGSNNTSRYFDYYFGKVPNIIRKNRNSVAVLSGEESIEEIQNLGHDIFDYFGLGCRNVSKLFIPESYDVKHLFEPLQSFAPISDHFKYNNNYDYNKSIFLVNLVHHFDNGFILMKEDKGLSSPLAVLYYEKYNNIRELEETLKEQQQDIQCVVSGMPLNLETGFVNFGESQYPKLWDYADHVNTIDFLKSLSR